MLNDAGTVVFSEIRNYIPMMTFPAESFFLSLAYTCEKRLLTWKIQLQVSLQVIVPRP